MNNLESRIIEIVKRDTRGNNKMITARDIYMELVDGGKEYNEQYFVRCISKVIDGMKITGCDFDGALALSWCGK